MEWCLLTPGAADDDRPLITPLAARERLACDANTRN
jgi:hypothetical protein